MLRSILLLAALVIAALSLLQAAKAEDSKVNLPADAKFVVRLDLAAIRQSEVGGPLLKRFKEEVFGKMANGEDDGPDVNQIVEVLGFDPFEEVQSIVVAASQYDAPEKSIVACVQLRQTTGNLEGLMLALPHYQVESYGDHQIHSARPEDDMTAYGAIYTAGDGNRTLVMAAQREAVTNLLDAMDGKSSSASEAKSAAFSIEGSPLAALEVFELPAGIADAEGPHANVAKIVRRVALQVSEAAGDIHVRLQAAANDDQQAEQLKQMAHGLIAMVNLMAASEEDEDLKHIQRLLHSVAVERSAATVDVSLKLPADEVAGLIGEHIKAKHND